MACAIPNSAQSVDGSELRYDVVVVGAGTGGIGAAIQASRMGARVALLDETDWIGGQATAAGVSTMDESKANESESGIYGEFIRRVTKYYAAIGKSVGTCYYYNTYHCFEPAVGQKILKEMISETNLLRKGSLDLFLRAEVKEVLREGTRISGIRLADGRRFLADITIDATEYGDLLPLAGAAYRLGNSSSDASEPGACVQDITYTAVIKKYPGGVPGDLILKEKPPGYDKQEPSFRNMISDSGLKWPGWPVKYPVDFIMHNAYRGLPDSSNPMNYDASSREAAEKITKTNLNCANDFPRLTRHVLLPNEITLGVDYIENKQVRFQTNCLAKLRTLQLIHYIQNVLGQSQWSIADDQGYDTPYNREENGCPQIPDSFRPIERHFPVMPYVREGRRIVGVDTVTAKDISQSDNPRVELKKFPDAVVLAGYAADLHNCKADSQLESQFESGKDASSEGHRFQLPLGVFIPATVDGFLAAEKNISVSRLVNGATRTQPATMLGGQASGAIAGLAFRQKIQPRFVSALSVQNELVKAGVELSLDPISDVPRQDSLWAAVQLVCVRKLMKVRAEGKFEPDARLELGEAEEALNILANKPVKLPAGKVGSGVPYLTRRQFAQLIFEKLQISYNSKSIGSFEDVKPTAPSFQAIHAVISAGIMKECSGHPRRFCPDKPVLRREAAQAFYRILQR
jgi:hypothetical protein